MTATRDLEGWTILFDLDGCLVDTAPDLIAALNRVLATLDLPPHPVEAVRRLVGHGAVSLLKRGVEAAGGVWEPAREDVLPEAFLADYLAHVCVDSRAYDGVAETLDALTARGAVLAVATNKPTRHSIKLLEALGLADRFAAIYGADAVSARKPDRAHLLETVAAVRGHPSRAIMVGDSETDIAAARAAGLPSILVAGGYSAVSPDMLGADVLVDGFAEVEAAVSRCVAGLAGNSTSTR